MVADASGVPLLRGVQASRRVRGRVSCTTSASRKVLLIARRGFFPLRAAPLLIGAFSRTAGAIDNFVMVPASS